MINYNGLNELKHVLFSSYSRETAYKKDKEKWNQFNRYAGQCAISAMIAYNIFGGQILCGYSEELKMYHYWNKINDVEVDFTQEQFNNKPLLINIEQKSFQELYNVESVRIRYEKLLNNVNQTKHKLDILEEKIHNCMSCKNIDKFTSKTVYYGKNCDLLFIGEAPAKNGWHITGKVWCSPEGKIIPSGKVFDKLLNIINLSLFDASFTEAIKCYPEGGKVKIQNSRNCQKYLLELIDLLKPNYVIPMGLNATKLLLNSSLSMSELAGKIQKNEELISKTIILPMYHPSPISPKGYKENVVIFERLKRILYESRGLYDEEFQKI